MTFLNKKFDEKNRRGIVLMMTVILLVILSMMGYMLVSRISAQRHRDQYIIDYQVARYACDSAIKYALSTIADINSTKLIDRPNDPDFSDLFAMTQQQYERMLANFARQQGYLSKQEPNISSPNDSNFVNIPKENLSDMNSLLDTDDLNSPGEANSLFALPDSNESMEFTIPGPYGPPWPYVTEPLEFEIGTANVKIEIEDENAKYPLGWVIMNEKENDREAVASFETFCEWMGFDHDQIETFRDQVEKVGQIKTFKLDFKAISAADIAASEQQQPQQPRRRPPRGRSKRFAPGRTGADLPASVHLSDFAQLFHSSIIDLDSLSKPASLAANKQDAPLKYLGLWASKTVNINSAPRHVLEAAFTFGGDATKIADEIIKKRKIKPFESIDELKKALLRYSGSIKKCEKFITVASDSFTIRVTATSGVATASAVIAVSSVDKKMQKIAVISG